MIDFNPYILAIESSCDDTAASVLFGNKVLSNCVANQTLHEKYGGVVPELASRMHLQNIVPVVEMALKEANINKSNLHAIAYTNGPGLMGSLLVGHSFAQSLALSLGIPLIEVNHMSAHILAHFIKDSQQKAPTFPFIALTVSGGHTQIVKVSGYFQMEVIGKTLDDAVGEAFDKIAKTLNLKYPGGPIIDEFSKKGNPKKFQFPIPNVPNLNFSFSGIKTNFLRFIEKKSNENSNFINENIADICASIQYTLVNILIRKLKLAVKKTGISTVAIAGGVSANSELRSSLLDFEKTLNCKVHIPKLEYTTDNAAMIGIVGFLKYRSQEFENNFKPPNPQKKL